MRGSLGRGLGGEDPYSMCRRLSGDAVSGISLYPESAWRISTGTNPHDLRGSGSRDLAGTEQLDWRKVGVSWRCLG